jgi:dTDP-4-dehydrorhamnose reductase
MRIVVLGPNGQFGSDFLLAARAAWPQADLVPLGRDRLDLATPGAAAEAAAALGGDIWVNCTGYHRTDEAEGNAGLAIRVNAHAVKELGRACAGTGARLFHLSTDYVFGGDRTRRVPYGEADPACPLNVYGMSKALGETLLFGANPRATVLRVASLFGAAGASGKGGNFVETMLRLARERPELRVVDDQIMSPTSTADAAAALVRLIRADAPPGLYHLVNSGAASWHGFAAEILRQAGLATPVVPIPSAALTQPAERPTYSVLDNGKLAAMAGAMPNWREALARYLRAKGHLGHAGGAG